MGVLSEKAYGQILTWWFGFSTCSVVWRLDEKAYGQIGFAIAIWMIVALLWFMNEKDA